MGMASDGLKLVDLAFTVLSAELDAYVDQEPQPDAGFATEYRLVVLESDGMGSFNLNSRHLGFVSHDYAREKASEAVREGGEGTTVTVQSRPVLRGDWDREPRHL